jgi:hypothetical protein
MALFQPMAVSKNVLFSPLPIATTCYTLYIPIVFICAIDYSERILITLPVLMSHIATLGPAWNFSLTESLASLRLQFGPRVAV